MLGRPEAEVVLKSPAERRRRGVTTLARNLADRQRVIGQDRLRLLHPKARQFLVYGPPQAADETPIERAPGDLPLMKPELMEQVRATIVRVAESTPRTA